MRIIQIITELAPAGAERIVLNLACGLREAGHDVLVVALKPLPDQSFIVDGLLDSGIEVLSLGVTKAMPWRIFGLGKIIEAFAPDVVHAHLIHANLVARWAAKKNRSWRLVNTLHIAERRPGKGWHFGLDKRTLGRCDVQTAVSQAVATFHADKLGVPADSFPVVYNGIEAVEPLSQVEIDSLRRDWGVADCRRIIGSVGRLDWQKGYDRLLNAASSLDAKVPEGEEWALVVIGEGIQRAELEAIIAQQSLDRLKIVLPGFRDDANRAMGAFDLFVMPSRYEGFGLTLIEAMGHGLPVLATEIDSLPELVARYDNGRCWHSDISSGELAGLIVDWIDRGTVSGFFDFSIEQMTQAYQSVYEETMGKINFE